jgi:flagellar protein FlgJ
MMHGDPHLAPQLYQYDKQLEALKKANRQVGPRQKNVASKDPKLYQVCEEFESLFIKQMLNSMKKTVHKGEMMHGGYAEEIFEDLLYDEYALLMAKTSGFGIADMTYRQLSPQESGILPR